MTKEEFFNFIEGRFNTEYNFSYCTSVSCDECPFKSDKKSVKEISECSFINNNIIFRIRGLDIIKTTINKNILREYEKYKSEILIEKLK